MVYALSDPMSISSSESMDAESYVDEMEYQSSTWKDMGFLLEVFDQRNSESCLAITLAECLGVILRCQNFDLKQTPRISMQYLMDYIPRCHGDNPEKCAYSDAYNFLATHGACLEECYAEFKGPRNISPFQRLEGPVVKIEDYFVIDRPTRAQLENLARTWLMQHPVICGIYLTHSFNNWTRKDCYFPQGEHDYLLDGKGNKITHALLLVDSKSTTTSLQFWAKNSYGENWGKNVEDDATVGGYAWIDSTCVMHVSCPIRPTIEEKYKEGRKF